MRRFRGLFLLSIMFSFMVVNLQAQPLTKFTKLSGGKYIDNYVSDQEGTNKGPLPVAQMPKIYTAAKKTMNRTAFGDTVYTFYPGGHYKDIRYTIKDSSGNSKTDSFHVFVKDTTYRHAGEQWVQIALKNLNTGNLELNVVPGDGKTVTYEATVGYGLAYQIRRVNTTYAARTQSFITVQGIRP